MLFTPSATPGGDDPRPYESKVIAPVGAGYIPSVTLIVLAVGAMIASQKSRSARFGFSRVGDPTSSDDP